MQYRVDNNLSNQINSLGNVNEELKDSVQGILEVIRILQGDTWEGKSKEAALSLLSILHSYHLKLLEASENNLCAMKELDEKASNYMSSGAIPTLWASDSPSKSFKEKVSEKVHETSTYVYNQAVETGKYIENKAGDAEKYVEDKASEVGNYAKEKIDEAGKYATEKLNEAGKGISDAYDSATNFISKIL